jgi:radical SAM family RiPP maturation amino acid epimerase
LSKGCSIGCSFCAFAAEKLQGVFAHTPENASLWREILETALDLFGPAVLTAICYWATEPSDNPDYLRFLKDFCDLTGIVPQTTTAAPLKNLDWTRELLQLRKENPSTPDRFSILSTVMLGRVHEAFSAEELLCVELVQQQPSAMIPKARSGRARLSKRWLPKAPPALNESRSGPAAQPCEGPNPSQGCSSGQSDAPRAAVIRSSRTISCLSGYLVSMMDRTIQLVSPCAATDRWPLGYRVHAQGRFANASDFRKFIERSIAECMDDHLGGDEPLAFRRDLTYAPLPGGFSLTNDYFAHKVTDAPLMARLGEMVGKGNMTAGEVMDALLREGGDLLEVTGAIKGLFDKGLLDDEKPTKEWLA